MVEDEGLPARQARHRKHHRAFAAGIEAMNLSLLPPPGERLWTLEHRPRARGRGRSGGAQDAPHHVQHRSGRGTGPAGGEGLARRPDGRQLYAANRAAVPGGTGVGAGQPTAIKLLRARGWRRPRRRCEHRSRIDTTMIRLRRACAAGAGVVLFTTLMGACATNPVTGRREISLMSEAQEIALGKESDAQIRQEMGVYDDAALQRYVSDIGLRTGKAVAASRRCRGSSRSSTSPPSTPSRYPAATST